MRTHKNRMLKEDYPSKNKEEEATLFMIFVKLPIKRKRKIFCNTNQILKTSCRTSA